MTTAEAMGTGTETPILQDEEGSALILLDECPDGGFFELDQWLPTAEQMKCAIRLNLEEAIDGSPAYRATLGPCPATSMRHGMGMIMAAALLAGALPFLANWIHATRVGTVAPFLDPATLLASSQFFALSDNADAVLFADAAQSIAGLEPWLPIWQAAGLSALGHWLSWPLQWLAIWIVYGVAVMAVSHLFGARTTLQHFFAGTSYACLPLLLLAFIPIPILGGLVALFAVIWALIVYVLAVETVSDFDIGRAIVSVVAPGVIVAVLGMLGLGASILSALRMTVF